MKLSIIVPVYNSENKIHILIDSIIRSPLEFEIICVNDGSTDNSVKRLQEYADDRIKIYSKDNEGTFKAWQFGLKRASGDYVTILDQDDYIDGDYLEYIFYFIDNIHSDVLFTPYYVEQENGEKIICDIGLKDGLYKGEKLESIYEKLLGGKVPYAKFTKVIRRTLFLDQIENTYCGQLRDFEDWLTMVEVFAKANSIYVKNRAYYHYIQYNNSVSKSTISYRRNYDSLNNIIDFLDNNIHERMNDENYKSFCFYALNVLLNKCLKIQEWDLVYTITRRDLYHKYLFKIKAFLRRQIKK